MDKHLIYIGTENELLNEMSRMEQFLTSNGVDINYSPWDVIKKLPTGDFYITSPAGQPRFDGYVPQYVTEQEMPQEWIEEDNA